MREDNICFQGDPSTHAPMVARIPEGSSRPGLGYVPVLTKSCWCILKKRENRTADQTVKLQELLKYNRENDQGLFDAWGLQLKMDLIVS